MVREFVIGRIDAYRFENLCVFGKARAFEPGGGHLSSIFIAGGRVQLIQPTFIFPGRSADEHPLGGKFSQQRFQFVPVKWHDGNLNFNTSRG
jgi:hypothetical protein